MQKHYKTFISWTVLCAIAIFLLKHFAFRTYTNGSPWEIETLAGDIGYTITGVSLLAWLFNRCLWKIPCIGRKLHTPNLNGTWKGKGKSSYKDTEYEFTLKIKQTFLETHVHGDFEKSQSHSFSGVFVHNDTIDQTMFVYSYQNDPKLEYRNKAERQEEGGLNIHYGTTKLDIDFADLTHLSGNYWSDRNTIGSWELTKKGK